MAQYLYGKNTVTALLTNKRPLQKLYVLLNRSDDPLAALASRSNIEVVPVSRSQLDKLSGGGNHQGYVALVDDYHTTDIQQITAAAAASGHLPLLVALDSLEDPHNLGAIIRSAECVGADGIIIEKNRSVSLNATVAKVAVGALDKVKVAAVTNLVATLKDLKKQGYWICGTRADGAVDYRQGQYDVPLVVVIGSEGYGMRQLVSQTCDFAVRLPMAGQTGSLNASVAAGVILYQIFNQRNPLQ